MIKQVHCNIDVTHLHILRSRSKCPMATFSVRVMVTTGVQHLVVSHKPIDLCVACEPSILLVLLLAEKEQKREQYAHMSGHLFSIGMI